MSRFVWRGVARPDRPLRARETRVYAANANAAACRERYELLRANGLCIKCKSDSPNSSECLACRRRRVERRAA